MMSHVVMGVDPGKMTGLAGIQVCQGGGIVPELVTQDGWEPICDELWRQLAAARSQAIPVTVVVEKFTITANTLKLTRELEALYATGAIWHLCRRLGAKLELQTPGEAKRLVTNERLKKLEVYAPTVGLDHGRDALRHAIAYSVNRGWVPVERLVDAEG